MLLVRLLVDRAKGLGAIRTRANGAENIVTIDSGGVTVAKRNLNGVIADDASGLRARLGLEHWQRRRGSGSRRREGALLLSFFVACGTRALIAQIREIVVTDVIVGPDDIDAHTVGDVNFDAGRLFPRVDRYGHKKRTVPSLQSKV